jgi:hypothetical protein
VRVQGEHGGRTRREVLTFGTTAAQLLPLRDWLVAEGVTLVGMESTGVFLQAGLLRARRCCGVLAVECPAPEEGPDPPVVAADSLQVQVWTHPLLARWSVDVNVRSASALTRSLSGDSQVTGYGAA